MGLVPKGRGLRDPDLRDRLYELLEHDPLAYSAGSRFIQIIIGVIVLDVLAMILASVPELDAQFGVLFSAVTILCVIVFALEYAARLWTVAGHTPRKGSALADRLGYAFSALGIIDLMAFLPAAIVLVTGRHATLAALGVLPFFKLIRYSPAMRSLLAAVHAERRALIGCLVILTGAVLTFASLLYAIERDVQPNKLGTIPDAMWWAIVTLGTVGYGDVVPVTALGKIISVFTIISGFAMIALPVAIISTAFAEEVKRRDFVVTWGMLARVPLFSHLSAPRSPTSCGCCGRAPSSRARFWCGGAMRPRRCISSPPAKSRSRCRASRCGSPTAPSSARSRCCTRPNAAAR